MFNIVLDNEIKVSSNEFGIEGFGGIRDTPANKFGIYVDKNSNT